MREIKFRGRDLDTGRFVYGYFIVEACGLPAIITTCPAATYEVDPKSVAQLVGYDANSKEVYEDDVLIDQKGLEYTISDVIQVELFCGGVYEPLYSTRYEFTLKGGDGNAQD